MDSAVVDSEVVDSEAEAGSVAVGSGNLEAGGGTREAIQTRSAHAVVSFACPFSHIGTQSLEKRGDVIRFERGGGGRQDRDAREK